MGALAGQDKVSIDKRNGTTKMLAALNLLGQGCDS